MPTKASLVERVYIDIKRDLSDGSLAPGKRVEISDLCARFGASKSPVRNVLNRLVGEGLLEAHAHDGFYRPLVTEAKLRDLYLWNQRLLLMALDAAGSDDQHSQTAVQEPPSADIADSTEAVFNAIAALGQSGELLRAVGGANLRLRAIRKAKDLGIIKRDLEISALLSAYKNRDIEVLRTLVADYHSVRIRLVPQIVASAYFDPSD